MKSSTAVVISKTQDIIETKTANVSGLTFNLEILDKKLENRLQHFNKHPHHKLALKTGIISSNELEMEWDNLIAILNDKKYWNAINYKDKVALEEYQLLLMEVVQLDIKKRYAANLKTQIEKVNSYTPWRYGLFLVVIILDLIPMMVGGFVGVSQLLSAFNELSDLIKYGITGFCCVVEGLLFFSVMGPLLKNAFGVVPKEKINSLPSVYEKQIKTVEAINSMMTNEIECTDQMKLSHHSIYAKLTRQFNEKIVKTDLPQYKESKAKKATRYALSGVNTLLNIAGGYFMATSLLAIVAAGLVGTPIGWGIIGLVIIGQLVGRFAVRSNSMYDMLNPLAKKNKEVREQIKTFDDVSQKVDTIYSKRAKIERMMVLKNREQVVQNMQSSKFNAKDFEAYRKTRKVLLPSIPNDIKQTSQNFKLKKSASDNNIKYKV